MDIRAFLGEKAAKTEAALRDYFAGWLAGAPPRLVEAMEYSLFAGGKRLRPALALGAAEIVCGDDTPALPAACAVEMIHTYSLIHDDLPAMDNDDLRRGKPTSHKVFGEALAILAGDGLLTMAFDAIARSGRIEAVRELAHAAGIEGMVGGQVIDMESEDKTPPLEALQRIHACKTGALIRGAIRLGAICAGATQEELRALTQFGERLGLAFQIADDILDVTGDEATIGKPVGSDAANNKATYASILGIERAREMAQTEADFAIKALSVFKEEADPFRALARFVVDRRT